MEIFIFMNRGITSITAIVHCPLVAISDIHGKNRRQNVEIWLKLIKVFNLHTRMFMNVK